MRLRVRPWRPPPAQRSNRTFHGFVSLRLSVSCTDPHQFRPRKRIEISGHSQQHSDRFHPESIMNLAKGDPGVRATEAAARLSEAGINVKILAAEFSRRDRWLPF